MHSVEFTPLANNTFVLEGGGARLLVDPFLEEELIFFTPAFFRLTKPEGVSGLDKAGHFDAVILTQHLPDHAHEPTLRLIDRSIPVVAPPQAKALLNKLGFRNVTLLKHGETAAPVQKLPNVTVTAGLGSVVGPPGSLAQLALVFSFGTADGAPLRVYHEPHGYHDPNFLASYKGIDAAIAPIISATIPSINYNLVNGPKEAVQLCKQLLPKTLVGFDNSGGQPSGFLVRLLAAFGSADDLKRAIRSEKDLSDMNVVCPQKYLEPVVIATAEEFVSDGKLK